MAKRTEKEIRNALQHIERIRKELDEKMEKIRGELANLPVDDIETDEEREYLLFEIAEYGKRYWSLLTKQHCFEWFLGKDIAWIDNLPETHVIPHEDLIKLLKKSKS